MSDKQLAKKGKSGVDNTFRRTWDKESYAERAAKREKEVLMTAQWNMLNVLWFSATDLLRFYILHRKRTTRKALWMQRSEGVSVSNKFFLDQL